MAKFWENLSGKMEAKEEDSDKDKLIKKEWNKFVSVFWGIFFLKMLSKGTARLAVSTEGYIFLIFFLFQFVPMLMMVGAMGYYSVKLSGRKLYILYGLFGAFWFATVGIFLGFFAVKRVAIKELKKTK